MIDADKVIEEMRKWYWDKEKQEAAKNDVSPMDLFTNLAITTVKNQPTAFDAEKVVKELEDLKMCYFLTLANTGDADNDFAYLNTANAIDEAIKIVKGGGVDGH